MKLSMETYMPFDKFGDEKAFEMIKNAGFDCVDYTFYLNAANEKVLGDGYLDHAKEVSCLLDKVGLVCNQAHAPFEFRYGGAFDESDTSYKKIVRSMEAASVMGADKIVVHSIEVPADVNVMDYNTEFYKSLEPYCERFGIKIAIENLFNHDRVNGRYVGRIHTAELLRQLLDRLDSPFFGVCIDVGHATITGLEPDVLIKEFNNNELIALHIHDNDYVNDSHMFPYCGLMNWDKIMSALKEIDYKGEFTLEVLGQLERYDDRFMATAIEFAEKTGRMLVNKLDA